MRNNPGFVHSKKKKPTLSFRDRWSMHQWKAGEGTYGVSKRTKTSWEPVIYAEKASGPYYVRVEPDTLVGPEGNFVALSEGKYQPLHIALVGSAQQCTPFPALYLPSESIPQFSPIWKETPESIPNSLFAVPETGVRYSPTPIQRQFLFDYGIVGVALPVHRDAYSFFANRFGVHPGMDIRRPFDIKRHTGPYFRWLDTCVLPFFRWYLRWGPVTKMYTRGAFADILACNGRGEDMQYTIPEELRGIIRADSLLPDYRYVISATLDFIYALCEKLPMQGYPHAASNPNAMSKMLRDAFYVLCENNDN